MANHPFPHSGTDAPVHPARDERAAADRTPQAAASGAPPVLFRMRTVHLESPIAGPPAAGHAAADGHAAGNASAAADSSPVGDAGPMSAAPPAVPLPTSDTLAAPGDDFPPPPTLHGNGADFPPPPAVAPRPDAVTPDHTPTAKAAPPNQAAPGLGGVPAGRAWTEAMASRLVVVLLLVVAAGAVILFSRRGDEDAVRLAEQDTDQLLADLGIDTGSAESADGLHQEAAESTSNQDTDDEPKFDFADFEADDASPDPASSGADPAAADAGSADTVELAASERAASERAASERAASELAASERASSPPSGDGDRIDLAGPTGSATGDPAADPDTAAAAAPNDAEANVAFQNSRSTINEPTLINEPAMTNEPAGDEQMDLAAPYSAYDSHDDAPTRAAASEPTTANRQAFLGGIESEQTAAPQSSPGQTDMPNAITFNRYLAPEAAADQPPANSGDGFPANPYAAPSDLATPAGQHAAAADPRVAQLPGGVNHDRSAPQPGYQATQPGFANQQPGYQSQPGYQQPQPGYQQPQAGYQQPQPGYQQPQPGYQTQQPGYEPGFTPPANSVPPPANLAPGPAERPFSPYDNPQQ